jgi:hypothetical protein
MVAFANAWGQLASFHKVSELSVTQRELKRCATIISSCAWMTRRVVQKEA